MPDRHAWIKRIRKGDVLESRSGRLRIVRSVSHSVIPGYDIRTTVIFTIMRCSWTTRCYTVYTGNDLVQMGYRPVKARVRLVKPFDKKIEAEFNRKGNASECVLRCCDVEGIA